MSHYRAHGISRGNTTEEHRKLTPTQRLSAALKFSLYAVWNSGAGHFTANFSLSLWETHLLVLLLLASMQYFHVHACTWTWKYCILDWRFAFYADSFVLWSDPVSYCILKPASKTTSLQITIAKCNLRNNLPVSVPCCWCFTVDVFSNSRVCYSILPREIASCMCY